MSTYARSGQGASLVGQPTPVYFLTYLLTYLLTYFHRCYLGAKLVYPPTPVKASVLSLYIHLPQFRLRCFAHMSTYLRSGQGASLVGQPTPVYFLTCLLRCYFGAKLVYPPTPVKASVLSLYIHLPQFRPRCFAPMSTYLSLG